MGKRKQGRKGRPDPQVGTANFTTVSPEFFEPDAGQEEDVLQMGNTLCRCNGRATPESGGNDDMLISVHVLRTDTSVGNQTAADIEQDGVSAGLQAEHGWNADQMLMADCDQNPTQDNNRVWAAARWNRYDPPGEYTQVNKVDFKGECVENCSSTSPPPPSPGPAPFPGPLPLPRGEAEDGACCGGPKTAAHTRAASRFVDVSPVCCEDGWYRYAGITVSNRSNGVRLLLGGQPLHAEHLAIAIPEIGYRFDAGSAGSGIVQDPLGIDPALTGSNSMGGFGGWRFPNSPTFSVAAWQGDRRVRTIIASRCRKAPTEVYLGLRRDIFLQVNSPSQAICHGSFDAWVKVLDYATD